jgi:hypothetical protein
MKKCMAIIAAVFLAGCFPALKTPGELAARYKCDPWMISGWEGGAIEYREQSGYADASTVMQRRWGDCKGFAVVALETLQACGIKSHIVQLSQEDGPGHVVTVFTLSDGQRGFINAGQSGIYSATTPWVKIIDDVSGGPWKANFAEEVSRN